MPRYVPNPAGNSFSDEIKKDEAHPRQHALAMASATHLKNMGHIDPETCDGIHKKCGAALKKLKGGQQRGGMLAANKIALDEGQPAPFGSFAP